MQDFLETVLPASGKYCVFMMGDKVRKNAFVDTLDNLHDTNIEMSERGLNTFYALSTFDEAGTREAAHATAIKAIFFDLDCGADATTGQTKAFRSKRDAVGALENFTVAVGLKELGNPWMVDSGGGVHAYWPLDSEVPIEEWRGVAEAMKRAAHHHGLKIDMTVTADAARVLRMPGTLNYKYSPPKPVKLVARGDIFRLEEIAEKLKDFARPAARSVGAGLMLPGRPPSTEISVMAKAMIGNSATYFKNIMVKTVAGTGCGQLAHYCENATEDGMEPLWRGLLSWAKVCDDGDVAARRLSAMHPYDIDRMHAKLAEIKGPYPCVKMDSENPGICGNCSHWGKITNPLILGRAINTVAEETVLELPPENEYEDPLQVVRPTPPRGFEYGENGGVYYIKPAEKEGEEAKKIMLTPYDFFMTRMFRDIQTYQAEFKVVKGGKVMTFAVPTERISKMGECISTLAAKNVFAAIPSLDLFMFQYTRMSMAIASATGREVAVPPRFGWQDDGSFVTHDTVYSSMGRQHNYTFVSDRLGNLINATAPQGSLDKWRNVFVMMRQKAATDSMVWGLLAAAGSGIGSILMHFMPKGARASVMHISSTGSGSGKSYAQKMAASVWGEPERYLVPAKTSQTTMLQRAGMLGSMMFGVDEITSAQRETDREWIPNFVFNYAAGMHKLKGSATGNAEIEQSLFWTGHALISSNAPALESMMGARSHSSEGEARRLLEWDIPKSYSVNWTPQEREVLDDLADNHGIAGPLFAQWCVENIETVKTVIANMMAHWRRIAQARDDERFWTNHVVSVLSGYVLMSSQYANLLDVPIEPILEFFKQLVERQRRIIAGNQKTALDVFNAFTADNMGNFIRLSGGVVLQSLLGGQAILPSSAKGIVRGRVEYDVLPGWVNFYIDVRHLKLHCANISVGYEAFLEELQTAMGIASVSFVTKNLTQGTKAPQLRVACICVTRSVADVEAENGSA